MVCPSQNGILKIWDLENGIKTSINKCTCHLGQAMERAAARDKGRVVAPWPADSLPSRPRTPPAPHLLGSTTPQRRGGGCPQARVEFQHNRQAWDLRTHKSCNAPHLGGRDQGEVVPSEDGEQVSDVPTRGAGPGLAAERARPSV